MGNKFINENGLHMKYLVFCTSVIRHLVKFKCSKGLLGMLLALFYPLPWQEDVCVLLLTYITSRGSSLLQAAVFSELGKQSSLILLENPGTAHSEKASLTPLAVFCQVPGGACSK